MHAKKGFTLRNVCGEQIIVAEGRENIDFSKIISMNESSALLWEALQGKEFTTEDAALILTNEYDVDIETATRDVQTLISQWQEAGIIE